MAVVSSSKLDLSSVVSRKETGSVKRSAPKDEISSVTCKKPTKPSGGHWSLGLKSAMQDSANIVKEDELCVVIKDKYPKAKLHWLVLPKEEINSPRNLNVGHVKLLKHMLKIGQSLCEEKTHKFRLGFHAVPSMGHIHMHVISQDFCSPCLKTKRHYNSFTTEYFVDATALICEIKKEGKVKDRRALTSLLSNDLRCHKCGEKQKNMPTLKRHLEKCSK